MTFSRNRLAFLFALIAAVCGAFPAPAQEPPSRGVEVRTLRLPDGSETPLYSESHALIIGVSEYEPAPPAGWPDLPGVKEDVAAVRAALEEQGFEVGVVMDPDSAALKEAVGAFIALHGFKSEARLLIYYAGHGHTRQTRFARDKGYIVPADAPNPQRDEAGFFAKAIEMSQIETWAENIESKHALFVFDSCFSGALFNLSRANPEGISYKTARPVRQFITAGGAEEKVPDQSVFRRQFCAALDGEADYNGDRYVTGMELGMFLSDKVEIYTNGGQHPRYGTIRNPDLDKGDFVFIVGQPFLPGDARIPPAEATPLPPDTSALDAILKAEEDRRKQAAARQELLNQAIEYFNRLESLESVKVRDQSMANERRDAWQAYIDSFSSTEHRIEDARAKVQAYRDWKSGPGPGDNYTLDLGGGVTMDLVWIPGGSFQMGSPPDEEGRNSNEGPVHTVQLDGFWMGKYEVTQEQYERVMGSNPSRFNGSRRPVETVLWIDAMEFCQKVSQMTGETITLPTEAQWEYACRAGTRTRFSFGDSESQLGDYAWYGSNSGSQTHDVGGKRPNAWGLYDMNGNVVEWCLSFSKSYPYKENDGRNNLSGYGDRVLRGGSWDDGPWLCRSAFRYMTGPGFGLNDLGGFRVSRSLYAN